MKNIFRSGLLVVSLTFSSWLSASQDPWKGDEYAKNSGSQKDSAEDFMQWVQFKGSESILDVGCGDGKITAEMAKKVPFGSVIGVDISSSMIQVAKNTFQSAENLDFYVEDAAKIDYTSKFDLITSFTVMQWVLEQSTALQRFEKALKPGGKLWIQMPTGLPQAIQQALEQTISSSRWKSYFSQFSPPWKFYQPDPYRTLLVDAHFSPTRLEVTTKHERFPSRSIFHGFLKQWFPYLRPLPADQKDAFLTDLLDRYLAILPVDGQGRVSFIVDRLEVEATKENFDWMEKIVEQEMQRELVSRPEIKLIGICVRTSNAQELDQMKGKIFPCVQKYFHGALFEKIPNRKKPGTTFCAYTDYETDYTGDYTYFIGEEVSSFAHSLPEGFQKLVIPSQQYVKFTTSPAPMPDVIVNAWKEIWDMSSQKLGGKRCYKTDFEIYDERAADHQNIVLDVYVGIEPKS